MTQIRSALKSLLWKSPAETQKKKKKTIPNKSGYDSINAIKMKYEDLTGKDENDA